MTLTKQGLKKII